MTDFFAAIAAIGTTITAMLLAIEALYRLDFDVKQTSVKKDGDLYFCTFNIYPAPQSLTINKITAQNARIAKADYIVENYRMRPASPSPDKSSIDVDLHLPSSAISVEPAPLTLCVKPFDSHHKIFISLASRERVLIFRKIKKTEISIKS